MNLQKTEKELWDDTNIVIAFGEQNLIDNHFNYMSAETSKTIMKLAIKTGIVQMVQYLLSYSSQHVVFGCRVAAKYNYEILKILLLSDTNSTSEWLHKIRNKVTEYKLTSKIMKDKDLSEYLSDKLIVSLCVKNFDEFATLIDIVCVHDNKNNILKKILCHANLTKPQADVVVRKIDNRHQDFSVKMCREACLTIADYNITKCDWDVIRSLISKKPEIENESFLEKMQIIKDESEKYIETELKRWIEFIEPHLDIVGDITLDIKNISVTFRQFE